jgi:DNA-directed RNA polymerase subunit D
MGLIPLEMEKKFEKNSPVLNLKSKKGGIVYSKEIDGDAKIVFGEIPITSLNEGQELELIAKTKMGLGIEHSKFNPGFIYYRNVSEISVDKKVGEEIKKIFPNVELKERGEKVILLDSEEKDLGDLCESLSEKDKKDFERKFKEELILTIESFGQLPVKEIFSRSIKHLKKDLESVTKKISKQ